MSDTAVRRQWRWSHGLTGWVWDDNIGCWWVVRTHCSYYCLGDRMFHSAFGVSREDSVWHGSYAGDWHGGIQTHSFSEAIAWLHEASGTGYWQWSA